MTEAERIRSVHLAELARAHDNLAAARAQLDQVIDNARQARLSWTAIGNVIGITKQGARQRWGI